MRTFILSSVVAILLTTVAACSPSSKAADAPTKAVAKIDDKTIERIRTNLAERLPQLPPIHNVRSTPMAGLYEVQVEGNVLFYADAQGDYLIQGAVLDTKNKLDLTQERMKALTAVKFDELPLKDAFVVKHGKGERELAVFADPNCHYCLLLEAELAKVKNVKVHVFLLPILGQDSAKKAQNIWCAKNQAQAWQDWTLKKKAPAAAECDVTALQRNLQFGHKSRIASTPTILFANGVRHSGALKANDLEAMLVKNSK